MKCKFIVTALLCAIGLSSIAVAADDVVVQSRSKVKKQGWLGVSIQDVTPRLARDKNLTVKEGAYINEVVEESPADSVGLEEGDVIVEYNGKKIELADDLTKEVRETKPGMKATLTVYRGGEKKTFTVNIGRNKIHRAFGIGVPHPMDIPPAKKFLFHKFGNIEGMELMELNKQLGEYFEAPGGKGLLVKAVKKESNAAKAGIKAGDVIIKAGGETIKDIEDIQDALADAEEGSKVTIEVLRKGKKNTVSLEVSEKSFGDMWEWKDDKSINDFEFDFVPRIERYGRNIEMKLRQLPGEIEREIMRFKIQPREAEV